LVRESAQNSLDAGLGSVTMRYTLIELTPGSSQRVQFLEALGYTELRPHLSGAARVADKKQVGVRLKRGIRVVDSNTEILRLLRIEDFGAKGLSGDESGQSPFAALVRNVMDSRKNNQTAGGSYGLGSRTLWASSAILTVLFSSVIHEDEDQGIRTIGKADLPFHRFEDPALCAEEFRGPGFLGQPTAEQHAHSFYRTAADTTLQRLFLTRSLPPGEDRASGTTALIVAFNEASANRQTGTDITKALAREVAKNFWPAMLKQQLTVHVEHQIDGAIASSEVVNPDEFVPSFTDAFRKHLEGHVVAALEGIGDTVSLPIRITVPATRLGGGVEPEHPEVTAECRLVVRLADPASSDNELLNSVGFTRGRGMITKYVTRRGFSVGARPYHAVLLAGTILDGGAELSAAETFLRWTEPPSHDDWTAKNNTDVYERYAHGLGVKLAEFNDAVFTALQACIAAPPRESSEGPEILRDSFQLRKKLVGRSSTWRLVEPQARLVGEVFEVSGAIIVDTPHPGTLSPTLAVVTESGSALKAPWEALQSPDALVTGLAMRIAGAGRFHFSGTCRKPEGVEGLDLTKCAVKLAVAYKRDESE
jgi:RNA polymerase primary sigma factor